MTSCSKSNDQKAKELIMTFLKENTNDPSSYESVEFGNLDSVKSLILANHEYQILSEELKGETNTELRNYIIEEMNEMLSREDSYGSGFSMEHKYRSKNSFGALILNNHTFYIDSTFTRVVGVDE